MQVLIHLFEADLFVAEVLADEDPALVPIDITTVIDATHKEV